MYEHASQLENVRTENDNLRRFPFTAFSASSWNRVKIVGAIADNPEILNKSIIEFSKIEEWPDEKDYAHTTATIDVGGISVTFRIEYYNRELTRRSDSAGNGFDMRRVICYGFTEDMK